MTALLHRAAELWAGWAAAASWQVALMVLLVAVVALAARRCSARFRYVLWLLVILKLFTPPSLGTGWGLGRWVVAPAQDWVRTLAARPTPMFELNVTTGQDSSVDVGTNDIDSPSPSPSQSRSSSISSSAIESIPQSAIRIPQSPTSWLALAWLAGVGLFLGLILLRYAHTLGILRQAVEVEEGPLRITLERLALALGAPEAPPLLLSGQVSSPFLMGLVRPRIILPASLPEQLAPAELESVLLHELMHWRRRDLWAGWLQVLGQALFWFHPLVWLAGAQLRHERECACDEAVLATGRSEPRQYGRSLLQVLMAAGGHSSATLGFLGIFERNARLQRRLEDIMNQESQKKQFGWPARLFILLFTLACLPMAPVSSQSQPVEAKPGAAASGDLNRLLTEDQRLFNEWTETSFRSFFDSRAFPTLSPAEREQMEAKLIDTLSGPKTREYYQAINTLAALRSKKAIPALVKIATDRREGNCRDRWMAIRVLGLLGDPSAIPDLIHLVYYPNTNTHYMAQVALVRLTGQNFGLDYKKWVAWWNAQGKQPQLSEEQIPWVKETKYLDPDSIRESDQKFIEKLKAQQSGKSSAASDANDPEKWLHDTAIVSFKARAPFAPKTAGELLRTFCAKPPQDLSLHHFRTEVSGSELIGHICVDGEAGAKRVQEMIEKNDKLTLVGTVKATPELFKKHTALGQPSLPQQGAKQSSGAAGEAPSIVSTSPMIGARAVDPSVNAIVVTFDRDMSTQSWSWTGGGPEFPPIPKGKKPYWSDARTCVLPVQLEAGHFYRVGVNAQSFHGFQSAEGVPVDPAAVYFTTRGASAEQDEMTQAPKIVSMEPKNGAKGVDPNLKELKVTFNVPMGGGCSWCGSGPNFPEGPDGARPTWSADQKTCTLPVKLKPGWKYRLGLNSPSFKNFQSAGGVPLEPVLYTFETGQ